MTSTIKTRTNAVRDGRIAGISHSLKTKTHGQFTLELACGCGA